MVFKLKQTLDSMLEQIELEETVFEVVVWSNLLHRCDGYSIHAHLRGSWEEFEARYPEEFDVMLERDLETSPMYSANFRLNLWYEEIGLALDETILNATEHGNKNDPNKKVKITRYYGKRGVVYSIEDEGEGFDIQTVVERFRQGETHLVPPVGGGIQTLSKTRMVVTANDKGNQIVLQYLLGQDATKNKNFY